MSLPEALAVAIVYSIFVVLCGFATYRMVMDELRANDDEDTDE